LRRSGGSDAAEAEQASQARLAERYADALGEMKGAAMKVGQILSFVDADGLASAPSLETFQSALARLQDDVPPLSEHEIASVIESELGGRPEEVFAFFSPRPIAAASIGQVHLARLADGSELAVKVQYPGVADAIRADLANTDVLASIIRAGAGLLGPRAPRLDPKAVVEEVRARVGEELDYRVEAANQEQFATIYDGHPFIHIPAVHPQLSTGRVLTMDYVHGRRWSSAVEADEALRWRWGEAIFRFVFASLHRHGVFNADPHPGNYLFHDDGTVTFLDFGCVKRFTAERLSVMSAVVDAALDDDAAGVLQAFMELGMLSEDDAHRIDPQRLLEFYRYALRDRWDDQPFTETPKFAAEIVARSYEPLGPWYDVTRRFRMPKDLVLLNRINLGASSVLGHLYARADWRAIDDEIRHGASPATELGRLEARWRAGHGARLDSDTGPASTRQLTSPKGNGVDAAA
jgi:predicted unusual protein kinase regulating ubiquinone biosynthesis (AarF/ABC1/UbiB family)